MAEKRQVCVSAGNSSNIYLTCSKNPRLNISSASSKMTIFKWSVTIIFFWMKSEILPGVPIINWGRFYLILFLFYLTSIPPTVNSTLILVKAANCLITEYIPYDNYLVGVRMITWVLSDSWSIFYKPPTTKAAVFPVPAWDCAIKSLPLTMWPILALWIYDGF